MEIFVDPTATRGSVETNERGLRLLEIANYYNTVLTNIVDPHKPSSRWKCHSPDWKLLNQMVISCCGSAFD